MIHQMLTSGTKMGFVVGCPTHTDIIVMIQNNQGINARHHPIKAQIELCTVEPGEFITNVRLYDVNIFFVFLRSSDSSIQGWRVGRYYFDTPAVVYRHLFQGPRAISSNGLVLQYRHLKKISV